MKSARKPLPGRSPAPKSRRERPKAEWNDTFTDLNKYKASEAEILRKKKLLTSKHNILVAGSTPQKSSLHRTVASTPSSAEKKNEHQAPDGPTSLDLVADNKEFAICNTPLQNSRATINIKAQKPARNGLSKKDKTVAKKRAVKSYIYDSESDAESLSNGESAAAAAAFAATSEAESRSDISGDCASDSDEGGRYTNEWSVLDNGSRRGGATFRTPTEASSRRIDKRGALKPRQRLFASPRGASSGTGRHAVSVSSSKRSVRSRSCSAGRSNATPSTVLVYGDSSEFNGSAGEEDLREIAEEIGVLQDELRHYEQVAGKRAIFASEDLQDIINLDPAGGLQQRTVLRYLVQLVCQSMTHLLQGEIELQKQRDSAVSMESQVDSLRTQLIELRAALPQALFDGTVVGGAAGSAASGDAQAAHGPFDSTMTMRELCGTASIDSFSPSNNNSNSGAVMGIRLSGASIRAASPAQQQQQQQQKQHGTPSRVVDPMDAYASYIADVQKSVPVPAAISATPTHATAPAMVTPQQDSAASSRLSSVAMATSTYRRLQDDAFRSFIDASSTGAVSTPIRHLAHIDSHSALSPNGPSGQQRILSSSNSNTNSSRLANSTHRGHISSTGVVLPGTSASDWLFASVTAASTDSQASGSAHLGSADVLSTPPATVYRYKEQAPAQVQRAAGQRSASPAVPASVTYSATAVDAQVASTSAAAAVSAGAGLLTPPTENLYAPSAAIRQSALLSQPHKPARQGSAAAAGGPAVQRRLMFDEDTGTSRAGPIDVGEGGQEAEEDEEQISIMQYPNATTPSPSQKPAHPFGSQSMTAQPPSKDASPTYLKKQQQQQHLPKFLSPTTGSAIGSRLDLQDAETPIPQVRFDSRVSQQRPVPNLTQRSYDARMGSF